LLSEDVDEIEQWAKETISYYCCKLRSGDLEDLNEISFEFPRMCFNQNVKTGLELVASDDLENSLWIPLLLDYCPNVAIGEKYRRSSHFMELYPISIESKLGTSEEPKEKVIHDCIQGKSDGDDLVDLTILFLGGNAGDWQHIIAYWGDEITEESFIDWMPDLGFSAWWDMITQSEYSLISGISG